MVDITSKTYHFQGVIIIPVTSTPLKVHQSKGPKIVNIYRSSANCHNV